MAYDCGVIVVELPQASMKCLHGCTGKKSEQGGLPPRPSQASPVFPCRPKSDSPLHFGCLASWDEATMCAWWRSKQPIASWAYQGLWSNRQGMNWQKRNMEDKESSARSFSSAFLFSLLQPRHRASVLPSNQSFSLGHHCLFSLPIVPLSVSLEPTFHIQL
jgi:hypothetical protein